MKICVAGGTGAIGSRCRGSAGTHGMGAPERDIAQAKGFIAPPGHGRHRPETTLLYQLVAEHYPRFRSGALIRTIRSRLERVKRGRDCARPDRVPRYWVAAR